MRPPEERGQSRAGGQGGMDNTWDHTRDNNLDHSQDHTEPPTGPMEPYLRLQAHIEALRADERPISPRPVTPEDARAYQMAALFHSASPGADEPDPAFVARLRAQLQREVAAPQAPAARPAARARPSSPERRGVSRRGILAGGLGIAASLVAGAAVGAAVESQVNRPQPTMPLVTQGNGEWVAVAAVSAVPVGAVKRFTTDSIVGFIRNTGDGYSALSGVCTHMACLLQWNGGARTFDCPCHGGRFNEDGTSAASSPVRYSPLPSLDWKVDQGQIWVYVAPASSPSQQGTPSTSPTNNPYGTEGDNT